MGRRFASAFLALALLAAPGAALAQDGQSDADRALAHFDAGQSHFQEGDYDAALAEFRRAYELTRQAPVLRQIADCEERLGHYGDAAHDLHALLESGTPLDDRSALESRARSLDQRAQQQAHQPPPQRPGLRVPDLAIISFAAASVGALTLAIAGPIALVTYNDVGNECGFAHACPAGKLDTTHLLGIAADVGLGVAVLGAAIGLIALLTAQSDRPQTAMVAPLVLAGGGGIGVAGWL
jgi:tetratricopeptide (TPR) repeat protein